MITAILSGGSGSRLWPISRESYPKQFCELFDQSFLRTTIERLRPLGNPYIVTLESMATLTRSALADQDVSSENIVLEPLSKNTAPAIALVVHLAQLKNQQDEVLGVFPADHLIVQTETFREKVRLAESLAKENRVVTIGVIPSYAATGYGYLEVVSPSKSIAHSQKGQAVGVRRFVEKPDSKKAEEFFRSGVHYWNTGIFLFKISVAAALFQRHMPDLWKKIQGIKPDLSNLKYVYANIMSESIDYGVMEKLHDQIVCIPGDFGWSDVGSWDEVARLQEERLQIDSKANVFSQNASDCFVYASHDKVVALSQVQDLIVVDTPDALLVTKRGESQSVKGLVEVMREARLPQASDHRFELRPWGQFEILSDQANHKVKRLTVNPGKRLSYQVHEKRDEHWTIISGEAEITLDEKLLNFSSGQQVHVPRGTKHRLANRGKIPLIIIEVQTGLYFGEDDIVRLQDDFQRR